MLTNEIQSERVVLELFGIDKKWVRSPKGEWVDKKTLETTAITQNKAINEVEEVATKKWWQFWK